MELPGWREPGTPQRSIMKSEWDWGRWYTMETLKGTTTGRRRRNFKNQTSHCTQTWTTSLSSIPGCQWIQHSRQSAVESQLIQQNYLGKSNSFQLVQICMRIHSPFRGFPYSLSHYQQPNVRNQIRWDSLTFTPSSLFIADCSCSPVLLHVSPPYCAGEGVRPPCTWQSNTEHVKWWGAVLNVIVLMSIDKKNRTEYSGCWQVPKTTHPWAPEVLILWESQSRGQNWLQSSDSQFPGPKVQKHHQQHKRAPVWHDNISWIFHLISKEKSYSLNLLPLHIFQSHSLPQWKRKKNNTPTVNSATNIQHRLYAQQHHMVLIRGWRLFNCRRLQLQRFEEFSEVHVLA